MRITIFTYEKSISKTDSEVIENIASIHETQNSLIFISDLKATRVVDKQDVDSVVISGAR
jgi:hypothetical protein